MADFTKLKEHIRGVIRDNCHAEITAKKLQETLVLMVDETAASMEELETGGVESITETEIDEIMTA